MDIAETWETIDSRVDWYLFGIVSLLILNILLPLYIGWEYLNQQDFYTKHNLQESEIFVEKAKMLEDLPTMDDIEISPPEGLQDLPERFVALKSTDLFLPPGGQNIGAPVAGEDGDTEPQQRQLPRVSGYEVVGRITGKGDVKASVIRKMGGEGEETVTTYIAREGEYLENTDVKVVNISDTMVQLTKPEHRVTDLQFEIDKISEKIRQSIQLQ